MSDDIENKLHEDEADHDDDEVMLSIPTIEKILKVQEFISYREGRNLTFTETIDYLMGHFIDKEILNIKT